MSPARSHRPKSAPKGPAAPASRQQPWTEEHVRALGVVTDLPTAAKVLNLGRALAYQLARDGEFPVPLLRAGTRYKVPVAGLLAALRLEVAPTISGAGGAAPPSTDLITAARPCVDHNDNDRSTGPHRSSAAPPLATPSP